MDYDEFIAQLPTYVARATTNPSVVRTAANSISRAARQDLQSGALSLRLAARVYMALNRVYKALGEQPVEFRNFVTALESRRRRLQRRHPVRW